MKFVKLRSCLCNGKILAKHFYLPTEVYIILTAHFIFILVPVEVDTCDTDANACIANTNGCTACLDGECVGK